MNKIKFIIIGLLHLIFLAVLISCNTEEVDTEKPIILINEPHDHDQFSPGEKIHFDAEFSDNIALKQFKIDIHLGEGHDHTKSVLFDDSEWDYEFIGDLEGRNKSVHLDIQIPENAKHGKYHFLVFCTDMAGNESFVTLEIEIDDDEHQHP